MRAVLSIGSNMDDRRALLQTVFDEFAAETVAAPSNCRLQARARTKPPPLEKPAAKTRPSVL